MSESYTGDGKIINSEFLNGLSIKEAKEKASDLLTLNNNGKRRLTSD